MKISIIYGWSEGHWHGKRLRQLLHDQGHTISRSMRDTDVIIAHSGGCFLVPPTTKAQLILLVGLPYYPDKSMPVSTHQKFLKEVKDLWWYKKTFFNSLYLFVKPFYWRRMAKAYKNRLLPDHEQATILLIRSDDDVFMHKSKSRELAVEKGWKFHTVPGQHDDLWKEPKPYVDILNSFL